MPIPKQPPVRALCAAARVTAETSMQLRAAQLLLNHDPDYDPVLAADSAADLAEAGDRFRQVAEDAIESHPWLSACRTSDGSLLWFRVALRSYAEVGRETASPGREEDVAKWLDDHDEDARWYTAMRIGEAIALFKKPHALAAMAQGGEAELTDLERAIANLQSIRPRALDMINSASVAIKSGITLSFAREAIRVWEAYSGRRA